jgi:hypothetical protein
MISEGVDEMKRSLAVLLAIALTLMAVLPVAAGGGGTTTTVQTGAQITGAGDDPFVKAKWESPDMDPCKAGVQIIPNPAGPLPGQGGETEVWVYAVVSDPNGIADVADVYFKIFHPDGSFKLQVHMSKVPCWQAIGLVKDAAAKGLIKFAEGYDLEDVLWQLDCEKKQAELWVGKWIYEIHQPAGWYTTEVTVVDTGATSSPACRSGYPGMTISSRAMVSRPSGTRATTPPLSESTTALWSAPKRARRS